MSIERAVFVISKAEKEQLKVYCDEQGFAFGKWMRKTLMDAAGLKRVKKEVASQPAETTAQPSPKDEKDFF